MVRNTRTSNIRRTGRPAGARSIRQRGRQQIAQQQAQQPQLTPQQKAIQKQIQEREKKVQKVQSTIKENISNLDKKIEQLNEKLKSGIESKGVRQNIRFELRKLKGSKIGYQKALEAGVTSLDKANKVARQFADARGDVYKSRLDARESRQKITELQKKGIDIDKLQSGELKVSDLTSSQLNALKKEGFVRQVETPKQTPSGSGSQQIQTPKVGDVVAGREVVSDSLVGPIRPNQIRQSDVSSAQLSQTLNPALDIIPTTERPLEIREVQTGEFKPEGFFGPRVPTTEIQVVNPETGEQVRQATSQEIEQFRRGTRTLEVPEERKGLPGISESLASKRQEIATESLRGEEGLQPFITQAKGVGIGAASSLVGLGLAATRPGETIKSLPEAVPEAIGRVTSGQLSRTIRQEPGFLTGQVATELGTGLLISKGIGTASRAARGKISKSNLAKLEAATPEYSLGLSRNAEGGTDLLVASRRTAGDLKGETLTRFKLTQLDDGSFQIGQGRGVQRVSKASARKGGISDTLEQEFTFFGEGRTPQARNVRVLSQEPRFDLFETVQKSQPVTSDIRILTKEGTPLRTEAGGLVRRDQEGDISAFLGGEIQRGTRRTGQSILEIDPSSGRIVRRPVARPVGRLNPNEIGLIKNIKTARGEFPEFIDIGGTRTKLTTTSDVQRGLTVASGVERKVLSAQELINLPTSQFRNIASTIVAQIPGASQGRKRFLENTITNKLKNQKRTLENQLKNNERISSAQFKQQTNKLKNQNTLAENKIKNSLRVQLSRQKNDLRQLKTQRADSQLITQQRNVVKQTEERLKDFLQGKGVIARQLNENRQRILNRTKLKTKTPLRSRIPIRPGIISTPGTQKGKPKKKMPSPLTGRKNVQAFIKQKPSKENKFEKIGKPTTERQALRKLTNKIGGNLRASGYLLGPEGNRLRPRRLPKGYRLSRNKKTPNLIVEKRKFRLDSKSETSAIQNARDSKSKKKSTNLKSSSMVKKKSNSRRKK